MIFSVRIFGVFLVAALLVLKSETREVLSPGFLNEMPKNCSDEFYCQEKHENYPQARIDRLLTAKYKLTLGDIHEDSEPKQGTIDGFSCCEKEVSYGEIYEIIDHNNNVRVVVQSMSKKPFTQTLRIEKCAGLKMDTISTAENKAGFSCSEKKMNYNFLVLSQDGNSFEYVRSKNGIPVCCSCKSPYIY